jgi:hypothetical protein
LFQQQAATSTSGSATSAPTNLHEALASIQARLLDRLGLESRNASHPPGLHAGLEDLLKAQLNLTLGGLLGQPAAGGDSAGSGSTAGASDSPTLLERLDRLHAQLLKDWNSADARQLAALALIQGWALGALAAGRGSGGGGATQGMTLGLQPWAARIAEPSWGSFRPHTCLRLQNFGNAEGYSLALFGAAPCAGPLGGPAPGNAAVGGETLRWGSQAAFMLDCSRGSSSTTGAEDAASGGSGGTDSVPGGGSGLLAQSMLAAAGKAAASVAAALDRGKTCKLAIAADGGGGGAVLAHAWEAPLLSSPKLDALRIRICNM